MRKWFLIKITEWHYRKTTKALANLESALALCKAIEEPRLCACGCGKMVHPVSGFSIADTEKKIRLLTNLKENAETILAELRQ